MDFFDIREPFSAGSHALWLLLSIPATILLWRRSGPDRAKRMSLLIFGITLAACALGSTLFHAVNVDGEALDLFARLDHVGIHLLIAGSYTPLAWNLLRARWRFWTLTLVWGATLVACTLLLARITLPSVLATCEYLMFGWGALFCYVELARVLSPRVLRPLVLGGVFYSVGAILNVLHWPTVWPGVVDAHGVFHLWVVAGSAAHVWFMLTAVVPFTQMVDQSYASNQLRLIPIEPDADHHAVRWSDWSHKV